jgi:hypothetical protein
VVLSIFPTSKLILVASLGSFCLCLASSIYCLFILFICHPSSSSLSWGHETI